MYIKYLVDKNITNKKSNIFQRWFPQKYRERVLDTTKHKGGVALLNFLLPFFALYLTFIIMIGKNKDPPVHMPSLCGDSNVRSPSGLGLKSIENSGRNSWRPRIGVSSVEISAKSWFSSGFWKSISSMSGFHVGAEKINWEQSNKNLKRDAV